MILHLPTPQPLSQSRSQRHYQAPIQFRKTMPNTTTQAREPQRPRCGRCYRSKKGCDGTQPICGRCRSLGSECDWPEEAQLRLSFRSDAVAEEEEENAMDVEMTDVRTAGQTKKQRRSAQGQMTAPKPVPAGVRVGRKVIRTGKPMPRHVAAAIQADSMRWEELMPNAGSSLIGRRKVDRAENVPADFSSWPTLEDSDLDAQIAGEGYREGESDEAGEALMGLELFEGLRDLMMEKEQFAGQVEEGVF
jgi:hypothetical protein